MIIDKNKHIFQNKTNINIVCNHFSFGLPYPNVVQPQYKDGTFVDFLNDEQHENKDFFNFISFKLGRDIDFVPHNLSRNIYNDLEGMEYSLFLKKEILPNNKETCKYNLTNWNTYYQWSNGLITKQSYTKPQGIKIAKLNKSKIKESVLMFI